MTLEAPLVAWIAVSFSTGIRLMDDMMFNASGVTSSLAMKVEICDSGIPRIEANNALTLSFASVVSAFTLIPSSSELIPSSSELIPNNSVIDASA